MTDREIAMDWWWSIPMIDKIMYSKKYYDRSPQSLTGNEIEKIYNFIFN